MSLCRSPALTLRQRRLRGVGDKGQAESTRTRLLQECIELANVVHEPVSPDCITCPKIAQPLVQIPTAPNQLSHILDVAVNCPLLFTTPTATYGCQPVYTEPIPHLEGVGVEKPQGPAVTTVYRKFQRIGGIDQISKPLVGRAGSDRTARLRAGIISQSQTRYVQTVLPLIPYPPCLPPSPQPGVPIAPNSGCNPGTRRVDYSNPRA